MRQTNVYSWRLSIHIIRPFHLAPQIDSQNLIPNIYGGTYDFINSSFRNISRPLSLEVRLAVIRF